MSKYNSYRKELPPKNYEPHPVWRGIGCFIILILPILSYAISVLTVDYALQQGVRIPEGLAGNPVVPDILFKVPGLVSLLVWFENQTNLYAYLLVGFFFLVMLAGIFALVYSVMYRVSGPSPYSEFDAPPSKVKVKKYRR